MTQSSSNQLDHRLRWFLVCLLLGVYLLVYVSAPTDADGQALLAAAATVVNHARFDINVIGYTEWTLTPDGRMGSLGVDGALYSKKGPTPSLALIPLAAAARFMPWLPLQATAMLFNALVTAATALTLYSLARRLAYPARTSLLVSLIFGLATFAVPYVKTLFGEPLAALLLLIATLGAHQIGDSRHPGRLALVVGGALGLLAGVNMIYVIYAPVFALYLFWRRPFAISHMLRFTAPLVMALALLGIYNWVRFGSPLTSGYHFDEGEGFNNPVLLGLYGLFFSPYRGLFWYSPVTLLSLPGWLLLRRRESRFALLVLALCLLQTLAFASWWSWHGGIVWGPRFLLPVLPLIVLALAPLIDAAWSRRWLFITAGVFCVLSALIQILGVLYDYLIYMGYLYLRYLPDLNVATEALRTSPILFDPTLSPIVGHIALLMAGWPLEPAWAARGIDFIHLGAAVLLIVLAAAALLLRPLPRWLYVPGAAAAMLLCMNIVAARQQAVLDQGPIGALERALQPPGTVVVATTAYESGLMDLDHALRVISMAAPTSADDERARALWHHALARGSPLWFVTWFSPGDPANWQERTLWRSAYFAAERSLDGHRALWFDLTPPRMPDRPGGWRFGPLRLESYAIHVSDGGARLSVRWSAHEKPVSDFSWFIHLIDDQGAIVAQQDRQPQGGFAPTSAWTAGSPVDDFLFFPLPSAADVSGWQLRIGWIDVASGERLETRTQDGAVVPDGFISMRQVKNLRLQANSFSKKTG